MRHKAGCAIVFSFCCLLGMSMTAHAGSPLFYNMTTDDYRGALKDVSSAWSYTSVSGASTLGHVFGFDVGVIGGEADTPKIDNLSQLAGASSVSELPFATAFAAVTVPFGLTVEGELLPKITVAGVSADTSALALKWTFSQFLHVPLDLALKVFGSSSEFKFAGDVGSAPSVYTTFDLKDSMTGAVFQVSKKFLILEPFATVGTIQSRGKLNWSGSTQVFDTGILSDTETVSGSIFMAGLDLNLAFLRVGAEAGSVFGDTRLAAKLSLRF